MGSYRDDKGNFHHVNAVQDIPVRFQGPEFMGQTAGTANAMTAQEVKEQYEKVAADTEKYKNPILNEREKTHGYFNSVAETSQEIRIAMQRAQCKVAEVQGSESSRLINTVQAEALTMMATKIARIVNGNSKELDHWRDIVGYAELVIKDLESQP